MDNKDTTAPQTPHLKGLKGSPSSWLQRFIELLPSGGKVLDLACGCGRNDGYLTSWGLKVVGCDIEEQCRPYVERFPGAEFMQADLENGPWPFKDESFDAVIVNFYLYRPNIPKLAAVLKPGGYLLYETFMKPHKDFEGNRPRSANYTLKPLELIDTFRDSLEILAYEETLCTKGDCFQRLLARKPINGRAEPVLLPGSNV